MLHYEGQWEVMALKISRRDPAAELSETVECA